MSCPAKNDACDGYYAVAIHCERCFAVLFKVCPRCGALVPGSRFYHQPTHVGPAACSDVGLPADSVAKEAELADEYSKELGDIFRDENKGGIHVAVQT